MEAKLIIKDGRANITVYAQGSILTASDTHPNWDNIIDAVEGGNEDANWKHLFSIREAIAAQFLHLSERVAVANDTLYFDGEPQDDSLATQTIRVWKEGGNFQGLVAFMENIAANPCEHSRVQLYDWLRNHNFTITQDGLIVGYKGCQSDGNGGFQSTTSGQAYVNGTLFDGRIPNAIGDTVTMPRNWVDHDPSSACSTGLHVGVYQYAEGYATRGALLEVHVNPRDVVSVPTDGGGQKIRVCRYTVAGLSEQERQEALLVYSNDEDDLACFECGLEFTGDGCCDCCGCDLENELSEIEEYHCQECGNPLDEEEGDFCYPCLENIEEPQAEVPFDSPVITENLGHDLDGLVTPGKPRFEELAATAKKQKKGLTKLAESKGWVLVGSDAWSRKDWRAPKANKKKGK